MNKHLITPLTALSLALAGCSPEEAASNGSVPTGKAAVSFDAYTLRSSRALATADDVNSVDALAQVGGFGVFAYEHGNVAFSEFITGITHPDFFNNVQVWDKSQSAQPGHKGLETPAEGQWEYSPTHYYSNNAGAKHSFFAYAPYDRLVEPAFVKGEMPQIRHDVGDDTDVMWAEPTIDMPKPGVDTKITFVFQHALSKVTFHVAPFIDRVHGDDSHTEGTPSITNPQTQPLAEGTTVRVKRIRLTGDMPTSSLLNIGTGRWVAESKADGQTIKGTDDAHWEGDGRTMPQYVTPPSTKVIPARKIGIEVVYDVATKNGDRTYHVTNTAVSEQTFDLLSGTAYDFHLDLGMTSVRFTATVVDWDVPERIDDLLWINAVSCTADRWEDVDGDSDGIDVKL